MPDLAGWRRERMPSIPDTAWFDLAPDWVCEILSPATARTDRVLKMRIYAEHGVAHLWLLDPDLRTLETYGLESGRWVLLGSHAGEETVKIRPFNSMPLGLSELW